MSGTTGTASTAVTLTPAEEKAADKARLLTVLVNVCGMPYAGYKTHPMVLALKRDGIVRFNMDFIHLTAANINSLQYEKSGTLVPLEMNYKMILRAFLVCYHHLSHKKHGGINVLDPTLPVQFKNYRNTEYDPTKEITPWGLAITNNKGLLDWNRLVKPSARDFKPLRDANSWVDYKEVFMITLEAQNLTHLVDPTYAVVDEDLHKAQQNFLYKVFRENMLQHEAKSIVKSNVKTKNTALIWQLICETFDKSMSTSLNGDAILGWLTSSRLDDGKWNRTQGEHITFYEDKINKFNEMCPDLVINDMQGVRMLQNSIANIPNLANVLIAWRQTKAAAGLSDKITLRQFIALLSQQAQVYDNGRIRSGRNYRRSAANHELDYEVNAHNVDEDEESLDEWFEANVMNQRDPKTGRYLGNRNGNKNTGFKKTQDNKRQANQMQGNQSRAFMNRETWMSLGDSDKKAWDQLLDPAKTKITSYHFNKGKEYAAQGSEVNQMEAKEHDLIFDGDSDGELEVKQHDPIFDDPEEEEEATIEVNNFETVQVSNVDTTRNMYEDEGVNFDMILQSQKANTRLQVRTHELLESDSSDEESVADLEVNMHNFRRKIAGLLEFSDSEDEDENNCPNNTDEAQAIDARATVRSTTLTYQKISRSSRSVQPKCLKECFSSPILRMKMKPNASFRHMVLHHPSKKHLMPMGLMCLWAQPTKVLLANKKVTYLVSPTSIRTNAN